MRGFLAIVLGIVAGFIAIIAIAMASDMLFPNAAAIERFTARAAIEAFPRIPMAAKLALIASWFGGAAVGAMAAKFIAGRGWAAWTVAGFFAFYVLVTTLVLPMPGWLQAIAVTAPLIGGLIANHLVRDRASVAAAPAPTAPAPPEAGTDA